MIAEKLLIVNFGGPRHLAEVEPFLVELLTDRDVIDSKMPDWLHRRFFTYIARKRAKKIGIDYELIGGKSPIFEDTEKVAEAVAPGTLTYHRYLPATHALFIEKMRQAKDLIVFPMFPQFSYTTTGSIARWFAQTLPEEVLYSLYWVRSYGDHPLYVQLIANKMRAFLSFHQLEESETLFLFSAHGLPKAYIDRGDPYQQECERSFAAIASHFPKALSHLTYQSKFGKGEWLRPYTDEFCARLLEPRAQDRQVVVIPLSFTSDHIETLFEVEYQYLPLIRSRGLQAYRLPALNQAKEWIQAIRTLSLELPKSRNHDLIRMNFKI